jgi:hypothetical protein
MIIRDSLEMIVMLQPGRNLVRMHGLHLIAFVFGQAPLALLKPGGFPFFRA